MTVEELRKNINNYKNLSKEKQEEVARFLIDDSMQNTSTGVIVDPDTKRNINFKFIVEKVGKEKAVKIVMDLLECATATPEKTSDIKMLDDNEMKNVLRKVKNGTATEEEKKIVKVFMSSFGDENAMMCTHETLCLLTSVLEFSQDEMNYNPTFYDFISVVEILSSYSAVHDESSHLYKYQSGGSEVILEIAQRTGDDILNTWMDSCANVPDDSIILLGALHIAEVIAKRNDYKFISAADISKLVEPVEDCDCEECCDCDTCDDCTCSNHNNETASGSNKNDDMRHLLKD